MSMFRQTAPALIRKHRNGRTISRLQDYRYYQLTRWQRQATGVSKWDHSHSHRAPPTLDRFHAGDQVIAKGTSAEAYKWWGYHQPHLPSVAPEGYEAPTPIGREAWPAAWTDEFAAELLSYSDAELRETLLEELTDAIFAASQEDGFELRRLDFEGRPLTERPDRRIIETFVLEEPALRDRILLAVVEGKFLLTPNSEQRAAIKDVPNLINYVLARIGRCRDPAAEERGERVPEAVQEFLAAQPQQPVLGFAHALPRETKAPMLVEWERLHQHDWQFGKAVYTPRTVEAQRGNATWLRAEAEWSRRAEFESYVASGRAKEDHLAKVRAMQ